MRLAFAPALVICGEPVSFGQPALSPVSAHVLTNQSGTAQWAYFSVMLPAGDQGFVLTAENVSGTDPLNLFLQSGNENPTEASNLKRSVADSRLLEMTSAEVSEGEYRIGMQFQGPATNSTAQTRLRLIPILSAAGGTLMNQVINGLDI